jgi:hypothetical protein
VILTGPLKLTSRECVPKRTDIHLRLSYDVVRLGSKTGSNSMATAFGPTQQRRSGSRHFRSDPHGEKRKQAMPLLQISMVLIAVGVLLWLVNNFIPMAGSIKSILNAVVVIGVIVWLLNIFGFIHSRIRVGA